MSHVAQVQFSKSPHILEVLQTLKILSGWVYKLLTQYFHNAFSELGLLDIHCVHNYYASMIFRSDFMKSKPYQS